MTELDLDAIKARTEAATEGPWEVDGGGTSVAAGRLWVAHVVDHQEPDVPVQARADATFIAAARTDVPALVAEVERLREHSDIPEPCVMTHTEPFDFAECQTHDTTFPLGGVCKFNGYDSIAEVYSDEADLQRGRAVVAEEHARWAKVERDALAAQVERVRLAASDWITGAAHLEDTDPGVAAVMTELADDVHRALDGES